jgi:RNA recognition motif-containing protein
MFSKFGRVESALIAQDRFAGRSKGFGFVIFEDSQDAREAISALHDTELEGII